MPPPLHFSLKMYYNDLTTNCSIIFYTFVDGTFTFFKGGKYGSRNYLNGRITL